MTINEISGFDKEVQYDKKIKKLNLELALDDDANPVIIFQDWTKEGNEKNILTLHLTECIEIKSIIDLLIFDYQQCRVDVANEDIEKLSSPENNDRAVG